MKIRNYTTVYKFPNTWILAENWYFNLWKKITWQSIYTDFNEKSLVSECVHCFSFFFFFFLNISTYI